MRYYSDKLNRVYDDEKSLEAAEKEFDKKHAVELKKKEERTQRAKAIDEAYHKYHEAYQEYADLVKSFVKDYGSYHMSFTNDHGFVSLIDEFFHWPF